MVRKMGPLSKVFGMLPGMGEIKDQINNIDEREVDRIEAIIHSMTPAERDNPKIIDGSRRARIAKGAGVQVSDVNGLVNRFFEARKMMSSLAGGKMPSMPGMPGMNGGGGARAPAARPAEEEGWPQGLRQPGEAERPAVGSHGSRRTGRPDGRGGPAEGHGGVRAAPGAASPPRAVGRGGAAGRPSTGSGRRATGSGRMTRGSGSPRLHLQGVVLPDGEHRDLWVVDGVIRTEPVRDARTVARDVWLLPGLVDAHCHVGLESEGAVPPERAEEHALADRAAGALLLRDAGSPADTRWMDDRADLPRIIRAGRHIARPKRYLRNYAAEVEPADLVAEVERQAARGDGWVKLVGDWIDRDIGDLAPLWPVDVARAGIARAHELGCRVTAHVFGEQALAELVGAGIDGIEHGTGLTEEATALMAERQVALVPTMVQLENFESYARAGEAKFPAYAKHIRALTRPGSSASPPPARPACRSTPAPTPAASCRTAWSARRSPPSAAFSSAEYALGAGSWRARTWLGRPDTLTEGAPADLVAFDADPRQDLSVLRHPRRVILRGRCRVTSALSAGPHRRRTRCIVTG